MSRALINIDAITKFLDFGWWNVESNYGKKVVDINHDFKHGWYSGFGNDVVPRHEGRQLWLVKRC